MKKILFSAIVLLLLSIRHASAQIPIVYYDFEDNTARATFQNAVEMSVNTPPAAAALTYTTAGAGCNTIGCPNAAGLLGAGTRNGGTADGRSISAGSFQQVVADPTTGATAYYQFAVNTQGFTGIRLTFDAKFGNNNAPTSCGILISPTGLAGSWTFVASTTTPGVHTVPQQGALTDWSVNSANINLSATGALATISENNANLYVRIYGYGASGGTGGGTWLSVDNLTILATSTIAGKVFTTLDENNYYAGWTSGLTGTLARGGFTATGAGTNVSINTTSGLTMTSGQTFAVNGNATITFGATGTLNGAGGIFNIASGSTLVTSNTNGIPGPSGSVSTTGTNVYAAGANYTFNAATSTPFPTGTFGIPNNVAINSGIVALNMSPTISGALSFSSTGKLSLGANTLTLNGTVSGMSTTNYITGGASSNLTIGGTGTLGTLFFDQTTDGTTNRIATLSMNRTTSGLATLGNKLVSGTAMNLTNGKLSLNGQALVLNGTFSGSALGYLSGSTTSTLSIGGTGALGTLFFDVATPGTTDAVGSMTVNRTASGTVNMGTTLSIGSGGLALTAGTLSDGGNVITLGGNITGTGIHTSSSFGKIKMTSSGATISGATLGSLELSNAGGFSLTGSPVVEGTLTFTSGKLTLGSNNLSFGTAATTGGTPSSSSMIIANSTGVVKKLFSGLGAFTYPIGDATNYTPITLDMLNGAFAGGANAAVNLRAVKHPNNANAISYLNRYWSVTVTGITSLVYGVTSAKYVPGDVSGTEADIAMGQYTGALPWVRYGAANTGTHTLSLGALVETTSDFTGISSINPMVTSSSTANICGGASTTLSVTTGIGDPTLTYKWTPATGLSATTGTSVTATPSSSTTYTVTVTDGNGFTNTASTTVNVENIQPITGTLTVCPTNTTTLNCTTGGGSWQSSNSNATVGSSSGVVTGQTNGTAVISYIRPSGCYVTTTVNVLATPAAITGTATVCDGLTTQLSHGVLSGTWVSGLTSVATVDASGLVTAQDPGTSVITYTVPAGCSVTQIVTVNTMPPAITGMQVICKGETTDLDVVDAGGTWTTDAPSVTSVDANGMVQGLAAGNALISYTNTVNCMVTRAVTVNALPQPITGDLEVCKGENSQLATLSSLGSWACSNPGASISIDGTGLVTALSAGTSTVSYTFTGTGCRTTAVFTVDALPSPITGTYTVCVSSTTQLSSSGSGTWLSSNTGAANVNASGLVTGIGTGGTANITYTLNGTGCTATAQVTVSPLPSIITGIDNVCVNSIRTLTVFTGGGTWSSSNSGVASIADNTVGDIRGESQGNATITYTLPTSCKVTAPFTVNPLPEAISGPSQLCLNATGSLTDNSADGTWATSNDAIVDIDNSGNISAEGTGAATITYTLPTTCAITKVVSVNQLPVDITGTMRVCENAMTDLNDADAGGTWLSGDDNTATVNSSNGEVTGVAAGSVNITYTLGTGCRTTTNVTVDAIPSAITGPLSLCIGDVGDLTSADAGTWSSDVIGTVNVNSSGHMTASSVGTARISLTFSTTGCRRVVEVTVHALPAVITGDMEVCKDLTSQLSSGPTGGTWAVPPANTIISVDANGQVTALDEGSSTVTYTLSTGCYRTTTFTVDPLPAAITGIAPICEQETITLGNTTSGGSWSSADDAIATIGSSSGNITGIADGNVMVTYTSDHGCLATIQATVNPLPENITGTTGVCKDLTTDLDNNTSGGTWSSSNDAIGSIDATTGIVTGVAVGNANITYMLGTGCKVIKEVTVHPLPGNISGNDHVCVNSSTTLGNSLTGGSWQSSDDGIATIGSSSGTATGVTDGDITITYTLPTGCKTISAFTVNPLPAAITGTFFACEGATSTIDDPGTGGSWSSSASLTADIDATGTVNALIAGNATITYMLPTGCIATHQYTVNPLPSAFTGPVLICQGVSGTLGNVQTGGTWISEVPATASVVEATGLLTGLAAGSVNVTYTLPTGCARTEPIQVNPAVAPITGAGQVCQALSLTLGDTDPGGTWTSGNTTIATVGSSDGSVTGGNAGVVHITYTLPTSCFTTTDVSVNPLPVPITGVMQVCAGLTTTLNNTTAMGTWMGGTAGIGTIDAAGAVTGIAAGSVPVTYKLTTTGCQRTATVTVNALPTVQTMSGGGSYCNGSAGSTIGLMNSLTGTNYALMMGTTNVLTMAGTNTPLNYGTYTMTGTYTVQATNVGTGCTRAMAGSATVSITALVTPVVTISSDKGDTVCNGTIATFTANPVNGGAAPVYEWMVNTTVVSASSSYAYAPANGDVVKVKMTSNAACPSPAVVNGIKAMTAIATQMPTISISKLTGDTTCQFDDAKLKAISTWGGNMPVYTWLRNGSPMPDTGSLLSYAPVDGDVIACKLTSNFRCRLADNVTSNNIALNVDSVYVPEVSITALPGLAVVPNTVVTLTATAAKAGPFPVYEWRLNGTVLAGATSSVLKRKFNDHDEVTCMVYGSGVCGLPSFNFVMMSVNESNSIDNVTATMGDIRLAPNPNNGRFTITGQVSVSEPVTLTVSNMMGQTIYSNKVAVRDGMINEPVVLDGTLANGMYLLSIGTATERKVFHFVLKQ